MGIEVTIGDAKTASFDNTFCGAMVQYPNTFGGVDDWTQFATTCHANDMLVVGCTDLLASTLLKPLGEMGIDICVGSAQRFGVPMVRFKCAYRI